MSIQITALGRYGHCIHINHNASGQKTILLDPTLDGLTVEAFLAQHSQRSDAVHYVLLTHLYAGWEDALDILQTTQATLVAQERLIQFLRERTQQAGELNTITMAPGNELDFPWSGMIGAEGIGSLVMSETTQQLTIPGNHTPYNANGFIVNAEGHQIYHMGPNPFHPDLRNIGLTYKPDVVLMPLSDTLNYGLEDISRAVMWLGCDIVLPVDVTEPGQPPQDMKEIYAQIDTYTAAICRMLSPGQSYHLEPTQSSGRSSGPESRY